MEGAPPGISCRLEARRGNLVPIPRLVIALMVLCLIRFHAAARVRYCIRLGKFSTVTLGKLGRRRRAVSAPVPRLPSPGMQPQAFGTGCKD